MGMPRGLIKATAYFNNLEAWKDWQKIKEQAIAAGLADLAEQLQPPEEAGWRKVDKAKAKLRKAIQEREEQVLLQYHAGQSEADIATNLRLSFRQVEAILYPGEKPPEDEQEDA